MADLIHLLTTGSLVLTAFLLFAKPRYTNRYANRWLAVFLWSLSAVFLDEGFSILHLTQEIPFSSEFLGLFMLIVGPTFYLSVRSFTHPQPIRLRAAFFHFLPFLILSMLIVSLVFVEDQLTFLKTQLSTIGGDLVTLLMLTFNVGQLIVYCFSCLRLLNKHRQTLTAFVSSPELVDLLWLRYFLFGVCFFVGVWLITLFFPLLTGYMSVFYFAGVFYLAYFALNQRELFPFSEVEKMAIADVLAEATNPSANEETKKALLLPHERHEAKERLMAAMLTDKRYLDNELTLPKLAEVTQLSIHKLSYLLNNDFGLNFYQFVNGFRIEEAKSLLSDPKKSHLSMEGIAYEAGFNSKTVFNTTFKKMTGLSPSGFKTKPLAPVSPA
ncbi:helix-turn-helix domain-containing protein [Spirosoma arcticum]